MFKSLLQSIYLNVICNSNNNALQYITVGQINAKYFAYSWHASIEISLIVKEMNAGEICIANRTFNK